MPKHYWWGGPKDGAEIVVPHCQNFYMSSPVGSLFKNIDKEEEKEQYVDVKSVTIEHILLKNTKGEIVHYFLYPKGGGVDVDIMCRQ